MIIKYTNSINESIVLNKAKIKLREADFFHFRWDMESTGRRYVAIKKPKEYLVRIEIIGNSKEKKDMLDIFSKITEKDALSNTKGKLYIDDQYIECFVVEGNSKPSESPIGINKEIRIFAPCPFWIQELTKQFLPQTTVNATRGLNYPFDYPFNYAPSKVGLATWEIDHYTSSHFLMRIYGPCVDPKVFINNYPYQVFTTLEAGDYLEIDTRNNTVIKYLANGTTQNCYNSRQFTPSIFEKIPPGSLTFSWPGNFGFDMTVFIERSEPKWDTSEKYYIVDESGKYIITE